MGKRRNDPNADPTIRADILAAGVGLGDEPIEVERHGWIGVLDPMTGRLIEKNPDTGEWADVGYPEMRDVLIPAHRPKTACGLAMRLDEWERARKPLWGREWALSKTWARRVAECDPEHYGIHPIPLMLARIERIGLDHGIRRSQSMPVRAGTLAEFRLEKHGCWRVEFDGRMARFGPPGAAVTGGGPGRVNVAALAGVEDELEAMRAIFEEVVRGK